jgi:hypothetical protein
MRVIPGGLAAIIKSGALAVLLATAGSHAWADSPGVAYDKSSGRVVMTSGRLELTVETKSGLNPSGLRDTKSGRVYADSFYRWPNHQAPVLQGVPVIDTQKAGACSVKFTGQVGPLTVIQTFAASSAEPNAITEVIEIRNSTAAPLDTSNFACGFAKIVHDKNCLLDDVANSHFCNVPYRRSSETGELQDYTVEDLINRPSWFSTSPSPGAARQLSPDWGAEGWAWCDGNNTLLISKYNSDAMEWSLLFPERSGYANYALQFGGAGRWKAGDPEGAASLAPGTGFTFGMTRYEALDGDWRAAYAANRRFTQRLGDRLPPHYDPPVHWNELYDNPLWEGVGDNVPNREKVYRLQDMKFAADEGREIGCQCLYLDPGWDTDFGSTIWADDRLGTEASFAAWLKKDYGMALALHTPLAPWSNSDTYPPEAHKLHQDGTPDGDWLVPESSAYIDTKVARLKELCKNGAYFLMFDGSYYSDGYYLDHGKLTKTTHQGHIDGILKIEQQVHAAYPDVIIEQHDPMTGPSGVRYTPTYFMYDKPGGFNDLWGFEFMNDPITDVLTRRACCLYYLDMAYDIPVYLHVKLWRDNAHALMLWWFMSTCRHLGMGGKPTDPAVWAAQKQAMKTYLPLKRFYTQGDFYGLDETIHAHTLPDLQKSVLDCFNLDREPETRHVSFRLSDIGLPTQPIEMDGASFTLDGDKVEMTVSIPALGHQLVRIRPAADKP